MGEGKVDFFVRWLICKIKKLTKQLAHDCIKTTFMMILVSVLRLFYNFKFQ